MFHISSAKSFVAALCLAVSTGWAAQPTVAVSYFDNNSQDAALDPLARGLTDMLMTDLSNTGAVQVVERERLNEILKELKLSTSRFIDPKASLKLGKGLSAKYILTGSYQLAKGVLRIDARLLNVESGVLVVASKAEGKQDEFFALEKELVDALIDGLALKLGAKEKTLLRRNATQSYEAWAQYSAGLLAVDERDEARARQAFQAALQADPGYQAARNASERLALVFAKADKSTQAAAAAGVASLNLEAGDLPQRVEALLTSLDNAKSEQFRQKLELLQTLATKRTLACRSRGGPALGNKTVLNGGIPVGGLISHCLQVQEVMRVAYRLLDDPDAWDELPKVCEHFVGQLPDDKALLSYCETTIVASLAEKRAEGADAAREEFEDEQRSALKFPLGNWRRALAENHQGMLRLVKTYAALTSHGK